MRIGGAQTTHAAAAGTGASTRPGVTRAQTEVSYPSHTSWVTSPPVTVTVLRTGG